ncbi:hypothetical protein DE146DRAFT_205790 [Phaeosphaeria sp. MPI-PUGE-AT-0046c]|nr:hypothetical protein DE146DRAFT_205790 [Phaeosphaeria sp. MPI-PUGE-AT-0046c]
MARYQLRRPSPVKIVPKRIRRQIAVASSAPVPATTEQPEAEEPEAEEPEAEEPEGGEAAEEEEEEEGPESPDSPDSSGSESSESESDSEDENEPPSPAESGAPLTEQALLPQPSGSNGTSITSAATSTVSQTGSAQPPSFTVSFSSRGNLGAAPQVTVPASSADPASSTFITRPSAASSLTERLFVSSSFQPNAPTPAISSSGSTTVPAVQLTSMGGSSTASADVPPVPAQSETTGPDAAPQRSTPQEEKTMISKGGVAAAITLSIIGAIAILIAVFVCVKRRKRRQNSQRLADDAFNPNNTGSLHAPETAHVGLDPPFFSALGGGSHLTRSTDRSDTLFGAGSYQRPETVSTDRNKSRFPVAAPQPTPNPFADPPLNKAYDVLAGRPRSTTLTDRGSWVKNPFRDPESERFDPFGELQEKARNERKRYLEESRKEAEEARLKEVERQFGMKEKMGLGVPEQARKGSGATIEGLGVLDRSGGLK